MPPEKDDAQRNVDTLRVFSNNDNGELHSSAERAENEAGETLSAHRHKGPPSPLIMLEAARPWSPLIREGNGNTHQARMKMASTLAQTIMLHQGRCIVAWQYQRY